MEYTSKIDYSIQRKKGKVYIVDAPKKLVFSHQTTAPKKNYVPKSRDIKVITKPVSSNKGVFYLKND